MPALHTSPRAPGSLGATWTWLSKPTTRLLTSCWKPCTTAEAKIIKATPNVTPEVAMRTTGRELNSRLLRAMRLAINLSTFTA